MIQQFEQRLTGGHPNSLGNTIEIVDEVLADPTYFAELFNCYFSSDEIVRLRVSNAVKRICIAKKELLLPYIDRLLHEVAKIDQASTQWTLALLFKMLEKDFSSTQFSQAKSIVKNNVANHTDWIILNNSMETLTHWAKNDAELKEWLIPHLERHQNDNRKSVAKRAQKFLTLLVTEK